jgi:prepilin-type N-terminal cleavage/methylation domain-containing protein
MNGGQHKQPLGYTIIEVMIVLAVSGVMFLIASAFVNGKQEKTAFTSGVNDMASNIQAVIEQVNDGQYSDVALSCPGAPSAAQGTNAACVFLGKMIYPESANPAIFQVQSIIGDRLINGTDNPAINFHTDEADATVVSSLTTSQATPQSLAVNKITSGGTAVKAFGFLQSPGTINSAEVDEGGGGLNNGGQSVGLYTNAIDPASDISFGDDLLPANSVDICMTDGTQYADLLIGPDGSSGNGASQFNVNVVMHGTSKPSTCV